MQQTYKKTILHDSQLKMGGRMINFGGWSMPVHYGSQILEHHAVRQDAGLFDVSHMRVIDINGVQSQAFLGYLLSNDIRKLVCSGEALYSCMCNPQGGVVDDLIVYRLNDDFYRLVVNAGTADSDLKWIQFSQQSFQGDVSLFNQTHLSIIALQGPNAKKYLSEVLRPMVKTVDLDRLSSLKFFGAQYCANDTLDDFLVARTGYTGEDGYELIAGHNQILQLWKAFIDLGVKPCGLGARDSLRIEAGLNLYGQDMDANTSPLDVNLAWTVSLDDERNFIGKDAIVKKGSHFKFCGVRAVKENGVFRSGQRVTSDYGDGVMTSGTFSPTLMQSIGLVRLPLEVPFGASVQIHVRGKIVDAEVLKLPFVRKGQVMI